jgi:hypothetical protein
MITRRTALVSCAAATAAATIGRARAEAGGASAMGLQPNAGRFTLAPSGRTRMSANSPYVIANPVLGFVNLAGPTGQALLERDRAVLAEVFANNIRIGENEIPICNVLFFYGTLEPSTRVAGQKFSFRDMVKAAGAHIAVLASEPSPELLDSEEFLKAMGTSGDWRANIVITMNRKGDDFGRLFHRLFSRMRDGAAIPTAWVEIAPQGPYQPPDLPVMFVVFEAANIAFGPKKS